MDRKELDILSVKVVINQSLDVVWDTWNDESQMKYWMFISDDYEVKNASNDLKIGGGFAYQMVSKSGGFDFDYSGTYTRIEFNQLIAFEMNDGRRGEINFSFYEDMARIQMQFEGVSEQDYDVQLEGWQALLNNFKSHVEHLSNKEDEL